MHARLSSLSELFGCLEHIDDLLAGGLRVNFLIEVGELDRTKREATSKLSGKGGRELGGNVKVELLFTHLMLEGRTCTRFLFRRWRGFSFSFVLLFLATLFVFVKLLLALFFCSLG